MVLERGMKEPPLFDMPSNFQDHTVNYCPLFSYRRYLFFFAHPDDDLYCCVLMRRLAREGRTVTVVYATSGDAGGSAGRRENEARGAMEAIGIPPGSVHFLGIPEHLLAGKIATIITSTLCIIEGKRPDCIVGHDYEGGHEGHDLASFCASEVKRCGRIDDHYVFPVYHGPPGKRIGAKFKPGRKADPELPLGDEGRKLKENVLACYESQREHFLSLDSTGSGYFDLLFSREVYVRVTEPIGYEKKPALEIGYESHRNRFTFEEFTRALDAYRAGL